MRISVPGLPGVYYETDAGSTAITAALSAAGRRAPKPKGYALQVLPYVWSFDVDLREVPADHPLQYLHPEGARSIERLTDGRPPGRDVERVVQFAWAVNREVERGAERLVGGREDEDGVVIEIEDGSVTVDGEEVEDAPGVDSDGSGSTDVPEGAGTDESGVEPFDPASDEFDEEYDSPSDAGENE